MLVQNTPYSGYMIGINSSVYMKQRRQQLGGSIFSAIFSGLKSLVRPLFGSLTKQAVKQTVVQGAKTIGKEAIKTALPEAGKALGQYGVSKLNEVLKRGEKPMAQVAQMVPEVGPVVARLPKKIDQSMIDNEMRRFRDKLNSLSMEGEGLKKKRGKKIMDYM